MQRVRESTIIGSSVSSKTTGASWRIRSEGAPASWLEPTSFRGSSQGCSIFAMAKLAESRDGETGDHLKRLQAYCLVLCSGLAPHDRYREHHDRAVHRGSGPMLGFA